MYITITSLFTITEHWQNAITRLNIGITRITRLNIVTSPSVKKKTTTTNVI